MFNTNLTSEEVVGTIIEVKFLKATVVVPLAVAAVISAFELVAIRVSPKYREAVVIAFFKLANVAQVNVNSTLSASTFSFLACISAEKTATEEPANTVFSSLLSVLLASFVTVTDQAAVTTKFLAVVSATDIVTSSLSSSSADIAVVEGPFDQLESLSTLAVIVFPSTSLPSTTLTVTTKVCLVFLATVTL